MVTKTTPPRRGRPPKSVVAKDKKVVKPGKAAAGKNVPAPKKKQAVANTKTASKNSPTKMTPKSAPTIPARKGRPPKSGNQEKETVKASKQGSAVKSQKSILEYMNKSPKDLPPNLPCPNCERTFNTQPGLKRHMGKCLSDSKKGTVQRSKAIKEELRNEDPSALEAVHFEEVVTTDISNQEFNQSQDTNCNNQTDGEYQSGVNLTCYCCGEDLATCHMVGSFVCGECDRLFTTESAMNRHKETMHAELPQKEQRVVEEVVPELRDKPRINCFCCGEDLLTAHISGDFECAQCSKRFKLKSSIERHLKIVHGSGGKESDGVHICIQCGAKCPDKGTLARHMYTHTGLKPYSCPVCKQEFSRKYHLVRHNMQTGCDGSKKPIFPCQVCGREFNRKDNLREHLRAHAGQTKRKKMFSCDTCGMEFQGTNLLQVHRRSHTGEKPYWCDFCPKKFPSSGALKKHRRTHTGERPYECQICQKRFAAKETLNRHTRIHTGYKPHWCQYCGKRFIQSSQLKSHLFYHTGQSVLQPSEPLECEICGKKFNRRARLNEHTKFVHMGAKPFECQHCSKTFIRKEDLNRHLIIHSGVKAHKCPICEKAFAMKSSLKVHLLTHTKEQPRSCDECGRAFIRQDCLLRHMRNKHRDMLEKIMSEAEKKKLQQQLLQMAAEANQLEGLEEKRELNPEALNDSVRELLTLLVDEATLRQLGWPDATIHQLLEAVIRRCGHEPAPGVAPGGEPTPDQLRHNVKLLFTVVIDDSAVKALLNNQTVDEVILHVLRLAKS